MPPNYAGSPAEWKANVEKGKVALEKLKVPSVMDGAREEARKVYMEMEKLQKARRDNSKREHSQGKTVWVRLHTLFMTHPEGLPEARVES